MYTEWGGKGHARNKPTHHSKRRKFIRDPQLILQCRRWELQIVSCRECEPMVMTVSFGSPRLAQELARTTRTRFSAPMSTTCLSDLGLISGSPEVQE